MFPIDRECAREYLERYPLPPTHQKFVVYHLIVTLLTGIPTALFGVYNLLTIMVMLPLLLWFSTWTIFILQDKRPIGDLTRLEYLTRNINHSLVISITWIFLSLNSLVAVYKLLFVFGDIAITVVATLVVLYTIVFFAVANNHTYKVNTKALLVQNKKTPTNIAGGLAGLAGFISVKFLVKALDGILPYYQIACIIFSYCIAALPLAHIHCIRYYIRFRVAKCILETETTVAQ